MSAEERIEARIREDIARGHFPGAAWGLGLEESVSIGAAGKRVVAPERLPCRSDTLFDLASLTKIATALVALRLHARGLLDLASPLGEQIPETRRRALSRARLSDLLSHASGLPAWRPLYLDAPRRRGEVLSLDDAVVAISQRGVDAPPRTRVLYSDLGFVLIQAVLERVTGAGLEALVRAEVAGPLGIDLHFRPPAARRRRCAATELGNAHERAMVRALGMNAAGGRMRRALIWGEVHDHNAWSLGGVAGHAGLFGTVDDLLVLGRALLGSPADYLPRRVRRLLFACHTRGMGGVRSHGLQLAGDSRSSAGPALSREAAGHTGFTGTSLWVDPRRDAVLVLLTNRMHPRRTDADMHEIRRRFHAAALA